MNITGITESQRMFWDFGYFALRDNIKRNITPMKVIPCFYNKTGKRWVLLEYLIERDVCEVRRLEVI